MEQLIDEQAQVPSGSAATTGLAFAGLVEQPWQQACAAAHGIAKTRQQQLPAGCRLRVSPVCAPPSTSRLPLAVDAWTSNPLPLPTRCPPAATAVEVRQPFGVDGRRLTAACLPVGHGFSGSPPIAGSRLPKAPGLGATPHADRAVPDWIARTVRG